MSDDLPAVAIPDSWKPKDEPEVQVDAPPEVPTQMEPAIGQSVRYVAEDGEYLAAGIVAVFSDGVELQVIDPRHLDGGFRASPVGHDANGAIGTWHYAEE